MSERLGRPSVLVARCLAFVVLGGCAPTVTFASPEEVSVPGSPFTMNEAAAGYISASPNGGPSIIASWNDSEDALGIATLTTFGLWINCTRRTCAGGHPMAVADGQAYLVDNLGEHLPVWHSDPAIAGAVGYGSFATGIGVLAMLGDSDRGHTGDGIVAAASFDGGLVWGGDAHQVVMVNQGTGVCDIDNGHNYGVDIPRITYDSFGGPSTFWVLWRGGPGDTLCLRELHASPNTRQLTAPGPTIAVPSVHVPGEVGPGIIRARGGVLYIVYPDRFNAPCNTPGEMNWYSIVSTDRGVTWQTPRLVYSTSTYDRCFASVHIPGGGTTYANDGGNGTFGFDVTQDQTLWVVVHDARNHLRVLRSTDFGMGWTTIYQLTSNDVGQPWLSVDLAGDVAVTYYRVTDSGTELDRRALVLNAAANTWALPTAISGAFSPSYFAGIGQNGLLGEYQGSTLVDPSQFPGEPSFFAIWTERDVSLGDVNRIEGARIALP